MGVTRYSMRLPHNEQDERRRYNMADPDALLELARSAREKTCPGLGIEFDPGTITREEMIALTTIAASYFALTTYELGQEHCVQMLRDMWRARKARKL